MNKHYPIHDMIIKIIIQKYKIYIIYSTYDLVNSKYEINKFSQCINKTN